MILLALALIQTPTTAQVCAVSADLMVSIIEARELGVPITQMIELAQGDDLVIGAIAQTYAEPVQGLGRMNKSDRQQLVNRLTAQCMAAGEKQ